MRPGVQLDRSTLLQGAAISLSGAVAALGIALRTHDQAPLCGLIHCPACYVAAGLTTAAILLAGWAAWAGPAVSRLRRT